VFLKTQGIALEKLSTHLWVVIQKNKMVVFNFRRRKIDYLMRSLFKDGVKWEIF
jgi:hypothetical protein